MTKPLMGTNRSDNRESRCRAKDPDHCPFHKPGSHVPYDLDKMMRMNEKVMAAEAKKAGRSGALKKSSSSSVVSKPVDGSIISSPTLNKEDLKLITRAARKYATAMEWRTSNRYIAEQRADFPIKDFSKVPHELEAKGNDYVTDNTANVVKAMTSDAHRKWVDGVYSMIDKGTMKDSFGIKPDDTRRQAVEKAFTGIVKDPKFADYMKEYKEKVVMSDPHSDRSGNMALTREILDNVRKPSKKASNSGPVVSKPVDGSIFNSDTLNTADMKFIARVGRRYAFTLMQRENSGDGDLQSHTDFHISDDPKSLASLSNETAEDMAFSGGHQKRRDSMYSALKSGTIAEAAGIKPDDDEKTAIRKGAKFISSDPKFISYMKNFQKEFTVHADDPAEEKYDSRISDRASTADGARSVIDRMLGRK